MKGVRAKKRKLSLVTVFALIEIIIIFLFGLLISVNLFVSNGTAKNRTRQIVEDSYAALTENLENDIKNISRAGFSLMNSDTVIRLKAYYYDKISGDSYARNTAINRTIDDLVSLTTYYDVIDSCALWIAPDGELSYNTLYTFVGDDFRKHLLDKAIEEHRYSPTYEGNLRNNGELLITLSLSEQDNSVLAVLLDADHIAKNLALTAFPKVQTKPYAEENSLMIICSDEGVVPGTVLSEEETDKPILRNGRIVYFTKLMSILPLYVNKIAMVEGEKQAPDAPGYAEVKDGVVYWERVFAASEYELEVDGNTINDLMQRTRPSGDAPMMCRAYKPTEEKAFAVGKHNAKIRSKNSAGVSEWKEFTFTVAADSQETAETFRGITGQGNNQYNTTKDFYTATINADKSVKIGFTAAATDEWSTYLFNFDTATIEATKLHIKVRLVSGNLEKVRFQVDGASGMIYGEDLTFDSDGVAELTIDVESAKLASSYGSVMLFLNKYATAGEAYEIEITDVSLF